MASNFHSSTKRTTREELSSFAGCIERLKQPDEFITTIFICLNTIITPLLKEYIQPVAKDFYDSLVNKHRINTQCYPDMLKQYDGNPFKYNYINGNKQTPSLMQAFEPGWDYRVTGAVDLTKLLIWKNTYNQFSECELCEIFEIITKISFFPSLVNDRIGEVRKVRNSVAHGKTFEWNKAKFFSSLDAMIDLINTLDIPIGKQTRYVDQLEQIREGSYCVRLINERSVQITCNIKEGGSAHEATIHGLSDQQEKQTLKSLETTVDNSNHGKSLFAIKAKKQQSIKLDLRADMEIYNSTDSFKLAVYELLERVITASGGTEKEDVGIGIEFVLPDNLTKDQLIVVAESFPGALEKKQEKDILDYKNMKTEAQHWKNIRQETSPMLQRVENKLTDAADGLAAVRRSRYLIFGISLFGAVLAFPFTGGASMAAAAATIGSTAYIIALVFEKYLTKDIMTRAQKAIDTDIRTTLSFFERTKLLANQNNRFAARFLETFPKFILADLEFSLKKFLKRTIESTEESVIKTRDNVRNLREDLEREIDRVDEIERGMSLNVYY